MNKTKIEWVKNPDGSQGYTWNPITGCLNHVDGMCKGGNFPCYAYRLANGRLKQRYLANKNWRYINGGTGYYINNHPSADPFYPRFWPERLKELEHDWHRERGIFVCDMSDLFGIGIPQEWTAKVLNTITTHPSSRFYILTKQPQNLIKWSTFPDNCWVGVTVCNQDMSNSFADYMAQVIAPIKYISFEPLLERTWLRPIELNRSLIQWLIIGVQTKPYRPPKIQWVEEIIRAAEEASIPVFLKDNLIPALTYGMPAGAQATAKFALRQEMPGL